MKKIFAVRIFSGLLLTLAALLIPSGSLQAQSVLTADAHTSSASKEANTNFGGNPNLLLSPGSNVYLKFRVSTTLKPGTSGPDVAKATVKLYVNNVQKAGSFDVYRVAASWTEDSLTHNAAPALGERIASGIPMSADKNGQYITIDVTPAVQLWLGTDGSGTGGAPNHGLAIVSVDGAQAAFDSKENPATGHDPALVLAMNLSTGPQGPQGPQGEKGEKGDTGAAGPAGATGPAGPQGTTGDTGVQGPPGPQGLKGDQGDKGDKGETGAIGATGPAGPQGEMGPTGSTGSSGPMGPSGPQGPKGDTGPQGLPGTGGGLNGVREFLESGTFTVPAGVTRVLVEMWGGGGAGGRSGTSGTCTLQPWINGCGPGGGGGGGAGGYIRAVVAVTPGSTYDIVVGAGGVTFNTSFPKNGGDSKLIDSSSTTIISAGGGGAGADGNGTAGGSGGAGGATSSTVGISRTGSMGQNGGVGTPNYGYGTSGSGGIPTVLSTVPWPGSRGGAGGVNNGSSGSAGYVLLMW